MVTQDSPNVTSAFNTRAARAISASNEASAAEDLLPDQARVGLCQRRYSLEIDAVFISPPPVGGDLWGLVPVDDRRLAVFCADVCGHGISVARHTRFLHSVLLATVEHYAEPGKMLGQLNRFLHYMLPRGQFAAIFYGVIDVVDDTLTYACSTFMPQLWRGGEEHPFTCLEGDGSPLGFVADETFDVHHRSFPRGAALVIYSDAIVETPFPPRAVFSPESLRDFVNSLPCNIGPIGINKAIINQLNLWDNTLHDDLTLVSLFRR